jgi:cardiolipin synthase
MTRSAGENQIQLLINGTAYFPALEAAIRSAKHTIHLQTYIYMDDKVGNSISALLKQAAQRGVVVNVLLDGFGSKELPAEHIKTLRKAGVHVAFYRRQISPWTFKKDRLRRMHRKVVTIDSNIAFIGGINIIDDYNVPENMPPRIDYAVRIEGSLVPEILLNSEKLWRNATSSKVARLNANLKNLPYNSLDFVRQFGRKSPLSKMPAKGAAALLVRNNTSHRRDIERAYLHAFNHAQSEIIIANAYFIPGRRFRRVLLAAAERGVLIKLLLQGRLEYFLMLATHAFYGTFLKHRIEIYEYRKGYMHSKVAVVDSNWATVGSSNIDPFSLLLSHEANVVIHDPAFAQELKAHILATIDEGAQQVSAEDWIHGNLFKRTMSWVAYGIIRLFLGILGRYNGRYRSE